MCGIFGFYLKKGIINKNQKVAAINTLELLKHRGPDHTDYWINEKNNFFLGHTRLSILDNTHKANQPVHKSQFALSYNGEIYNYKELRNELKKDFTFSSSGDTEVLFNFLLKNKTDQIEKLDGMFAFAFFNFGELYLCNDIFGEKPIYYIQNQDGFFFASEIKPLINFLKIKKDDSPLKRDKFLMFGSLREDTLYKDLNYCPPASILKIEKGILIQKKQYWSYKNLLETRDKKKIIEKKDITQIKNLLISSCEKKLNSDQPIALMLSSGTDSSLLASIYKKELNINLESFHASFENLKNSNSEVNETDLTKKIAIALDLNLTIKKIDIDEKFFSNKNLFELFNEPNDNISTLLLYSINRSISEKYKVAISGLGADEIFYGYNGYSFFNKNIKFIQSNFLNKTLKYFDKIEFGKLKTLKYYNKYSGLDLIFSHFNFDYYEDIENKYHDNLEYNNKLSFIENYSLIRFSSTLPYQMLSASDKASMHTSLEVRSPYLNKELLQKVLEFDPNTLINYGHKYLQKKILEDYLPKNLINQKKIGFILNTKTFIENSFSEIVKRKDKSFEFNRLNLRKLMYKDFFYNEN